MTQWLFKLPFFPSLCVCLCLFVPLFYHGFAAAMNQHDATFTVPALGLQIVQTLHTFLIPGFY